MGCQFSKAPKQGVLRAALAMPTQARTQSPGLALPHLPSPLPATQLANDLPFKGRSHEQARDRAAEALGRDPGRRRAMPPIRSFALHACRKSGGAAPHACVLATQADSESFGTVPAHLSRR